MSSDGSDTQQSTQAAFDANFDEVKAALEAGADVNGSPEQPFPPVVAATIADDHGMVNALLEQGADPDRPVACEVPFPSSDIGISSTIPGERALHIAARSGKVEIVRLLLERSRADPNATDNTGCTPLAMACDCQHVCVEVVRLLLEAGADPALADEEGGCLPLHAVALNGHMDLVDMLYSRAPTTLNCCTPNGMTPLFWACHGGSESMVSKLLSLGAMQPMPIIQREVCPLTVAVCDGFVGVVRVLMNEGGIWAVGGEEPLLKALIVAVRSRQARIFQLLLTWDGEERRSKWVNTSLQSWCLLHYGAAYCYPVAVSILLQAGANEEARDLDGRIALDVIGLDIGQDTPEMDPGQEVAIRRMLQRGPAYRACSWAWPSDEEADAGGSCTAGAASAAVLSSPPALKTPPVIGVRIFRPKEKNNSKLFVRLVGRYCSED